jgi:hypothetical protein
MISCLKKIIIQRQGLRFNYNYGLAISKNIHYQKALLASETIKIIISESHYDIKDISLKDKIVKTIKENK